jgi:hypothetical protein
MFLLQDIFGWLLALLLLAVPGVIAAILWAPFLVSRRVRSLFVTLPPRGSLISTYVGVILLASLPYVLGLLAVIAIVPSEEAALSNAILTLVQYLGVAYVFLVPTAAVFGLPRIGITWDPSGSRVTSWLLLALGGFWYSLTFAVPMFLLAVLLVLPGGY